MTVVVSSIAFTVDQVDAPSERVFGECIPSVFCVCVVRKALLLALGIKSRRLGAAAAMSWVLKDALGKCGRILWASKMGRRFDSDAKRWRFRSRRGLFTISAFDSDSWGWIRRK